MKIVITGSTGFVGSNLMKELSQPPFEIATIDLRKDLNKINSLVNDAYAIIHLAGKAHDLKNVGDEHEYYFVNYDLTKKMYDVFLGSGAAKFIFLSSVKACRDSIEGVLTEDVVPDPQTVYGKSKLKAEQYILNSALPEGKFVYILRPCMIHGPGNKGNLNLLYQFIRKQIPYPLGSFENKRSYISILNLNFILRNLLVMKVEPGIYHLADDVPLSTSYVVCLIAGSLSKKKRIWHLPKSIIRALAKAGDLLYLPFNSEKLKKMTESYVVSNHKIKAALGAELPVSSEEGLLFTFQSFKNQ